MNLTLNYEGFEDNFVMTQTHLNGIQYVFRFENGFGASVIKHDGSYGHELDLWELAVIEWYSDANEDGWNLTYDTPITDDVIGHLTNEEVIDLLQQIKEL